MPAVEIMPAQIALRSSILSLTISNYWFARGVQFLRSERPPKLYKQTAFSCYSRHACFFNFHPHDSYFSQRCMRGY